MSRGYQRGGPVVCYKRGVLEGLIPIQGCLEARSRIMDIFEFEPRSRIITINPGYLNQDSPIEYRPNPESWIKW